MKFSDFVDVADEINNESKTTVIVEYVSELFSTVDDDSLEIVPRFIQGEIFPAYDERKTRISTSLMRQAYFRSNRCRRKIKLNHP
jgi:DNA ligase N terminus.